MDQQRKDWYYSCMTKPAHIPDYSLFGETDTFPDVVHCEHIRDRAPDHGWIIAPHRHAQLAQVFFIEAGSAKATADGQSFDLRDGMMLFVPAQVVHSFAFAPQTQGIVQSFPLSILTSIGPVSGDIARALSRPFVGRPAQALIAQMALLDDALAQNGPFRAQIAVGLAHAVLSMTASLNDSPAGNGPAPDGRLARLDRLIAQHQGQNWTARDYAAEMTLSTGHLSRLCRAAKGVSASAYIEATTVQEACRLLAFTQLSVAEIGYRLGFGDPSYFSRRFKSVQGQTPSVYRQKFTN
ncbi:helix-turn-helix domain-containing protein [Roseobacter sp. GAI101]|uniref:helix-turn-helix domain-containing protein n=1 Tax=Roseobacter sp. (strain GAI101) TaxID=391589 RepID=UPI0001871C4E|nr:helix-turn-helix domain-containing protein [Roseobacter sp. GAI101]EEB83190.1 transcriptional regulatory protein [Roseobacter sp. GAI101]